MTRISVPYRLLGLAAVAFATIFSSNVYSQSGRATLINAAPTQQTCLYSSIAMQPTGQIDITCTATTVPGALGSIGFNTSAYAPVTKDATTASVSITITLVRTGGSTGVLDATLTASAPCSPAPLAIHFGDGVTSAPYTVTATATGTCALSLTAVTAGSTLGLSSSSVAINAPATGGNVTPAPAGCPATPSNVVMNTMGGQSVNQHVRDLPVGSIQTFPLPLTRVTGAVLTGGVIGFGTDTISTPSSMGVELSISKCPGDFDTPKVNTVSLFGIAFVPCDKSGTGENASINWNVGASTVGGCGVPAGEQWYVNWKITSGCPAGQACGQFFYWNTN